MFFKRNDNNKLTYNPIELELLFNEILDNTIKTSEELEFCVNALGEALRCAANDWFEDEGYEDFYEHCQFDIYFDNEVERVEE